MPLNISRKTGSFLLAGAASVALLGASLSIASSPRQVEQVPPQERKAEKVRVGTYEPQQVFQSSPHAIRLNERIGELQRQAQEAQEEGDHQRAMQIQGQMQAVQNEVVQEFLADVDEVIPTLAKEAGVRLVALQVVWTDEEIGEPKDLSGDLIAQLNGDDDDDDDDAPARSPFMPPGQ